ncbi:MAG: hypothetical protein GEV07_26620 [Streptosporangiales bacterium]|nr:hypothetical protein [Streptosporangiales bacterium]
MDEPDIVEQGPQRPRRRLLPALVGLVALALAGYAVVARVTDGEPAADRSPTQGTWSGDSRPQWPTARGGDVLLPIAAAEALDRPIGGHVLVGGERLVRVGLDSRLRATVADWPVSALQRRGDDVYALSTTCDRTETTVLRYSGRSVAHAVRMAGRVDDVLAGPAGAWGVDLPNDPNGRAVLRPVDGGTAVRLPRRVLPLGVSATGVVGQRSARLSSDEGPRIVLLDPDTGRIEHRIAKGHVLHVGADFVLWTGEACRFLPGVRGVDPTDRRCTIHRTPIDGAGGSTYRLPFNQTPTGQAVSSADGRFAAFQLARDLLRQRYVHSHPVPPTSVAVLDLDTGDLEIVPHLQFAAKSSVGLTFAADGEWLVLATNYGDHVRLFAWQRGTARLWRVPGRLVGRTEQVPLVLVD